VSSLRFFQVDVFARARFGGNPLAVFIGADGVETGLMQQIAREMNLSETTFVQTPKQREHAALVRIFTPGQELPFAGHPTVGTAFVLTRLGLVNAPQFTFEEGVGPVGLRRGDEPDFFWMQPPLPPVDATFHDTAGIAAALGLSAGEIAAPARSIGAGLLNFLCVALRSKSAVDDLRIDREKLVTPTSEKAAFGDLLIFHYASGSAHSRMFAHPESGIGEDPATGSSVAPLVFALYHGGLLEPECASLVVEQGTKMRRQSFLHARFTRDAKGAPSNIEVGGRSIFVFEATLEL